MDTVTFKTGLELRLVAEKISYGYPGHLVGSQLDLSVTPGEVLCLLGPNGCGKTTLFKTLLGLLPVYGGCITLDERDLHSWGRRDIAKVLAYVPQQHDAYFPFTVREVVLMGRSTHVGLFSTPGKADQEIAQQALKGLHIENLADHIYTQVSGGERQLTLIARAMAQQPRVLVLDEPTANLDFGNQVLVLEHIRQLKRHGLTVVLSTHDPDQAFYCADKVMMLKNGSVLESGETRTVINAHNLKQLYGVDVEIVPLPDHAPVCVPKIRGDAST